MTFDQALKLSIVITLCISILGIAVQLMRLIAATVDIFKDARQSVKNVGELTSKFNTDYDFASEQVREIFKLIKNFRETVISPMQTVLKLIGRFTSRS